MNHLETMGESVTAVIDKVRREVHEVERRLRVQIMVCDECGEGWSRPMKRGRRPKACPACRGSTTRSGADTPSPAAGPSGTAK